MSLAVYSVVAVWIVSDSLKYFFTASSGIQTFPEFVAVGVVDEIEMIHYDGLTAKAELKHDWVHTITKAHPDYLEYNTPKFVSAQQVYKINMEVAKERFNQNGVLPSVSLLQKSSSSSVTCHATGFYPDTAEMFWRKNGKEIQDDVDKGEILTNHDGTFQMSVYLDLSSIKPDHWQRYDCVFQLSGVNEDIVTKVDKAVIRTNERDKNVPRTTQGLN
ncbi:unnamed protein product [Oreochromis niloticus]|nr:unnamed protein product [Mustela putorius furo]